MIFGDYKLELNYLRKKQVNSDMFISENNGQFPTLLNSKAVEVISKLDGQNTLDQVVQMLSQVWQCSLEQASNDIENILIMLQSRGLLRDFTVGISVNKVRLSNRAYFEIYPYCNFQCLHCSSLLEGQSPSLSKSHILSAMNQLSYFGINEFVITGGEPFLHKEIREILEEAVKLYKIIVTTNGSQLPSWIFQFAKENPNLILQFSLDGVSKDVFEKVRGKDTYKNVYMNLMKMIEIGNSNRLAISFTCMAINYAEIDQLIDFCITHKISILHFPNLLPIGNALKYWNELGLSTNQQKELGRKLVGFQRKCKDKICISSPYISYIESGLREEAHYGPQVQSSCFDIFTIKISSDGSIFPCPVGWQKKHILGNILDINLKEELIPKLNLNRFKLKTDAQKSLKKCISCPLEQACKGIYCENCGILGTFYEPAINSRCESNLNIAAKIIK